MSEQRVRHRRSDRYKTNSPTTNDGQYDYSACDSVNEQPVPYRSDNAFAPNMQTNQRALPPKQQEQIGDNQPQMPLVNGRTWENQAPKKSRTEGSHVYPERFAQKSNIVLPVAANTSKKKKRKRAPHKSRRFPVRLLAVLLLIVLVPSAVLWTVNLPEVRQFWREHGLMQRAEEEERKIPETDMGDMTYWKTPEENIVTEKGISFVNNELLVILQSRENKPDLEKYIASFEGAIVGEIPVIAEYQVLLNQPQPFEALQMLTADLNQQSWVRHASVNYGLEMNTQATPNDYNWSEKWSEVPEGKNWGLEAIHAPEAWDYIDESRPAVNIGVIDLMFDTNHPDLVFEERPLGNLDALKGEWNDHGTHVAGIMAATTNNFRGIAGVSQRHHLYGAAVNGLGGTVHAINMALCYLISQKECSVINISIGDVRSPFAASRQKPVAIEALNDAATLIEAVLYGLMEDGNQFVICKASGNQNEVQQGIHWTADGRLVTDQGKEVDQDLVYIPKDNPEDSDEFPYYTLKEYLTEHPDAVVEDLVTDSGNVDADYDYFGYIQNPKVKDRIIMVGAVGTLGTRKEGGFAFIGGKKVHNGYYIAPFSQCGKRLDILAPGENIYSCIKGGYASWPGTSMATPYVAGVAALLFNVNPQLSGSDVKKIICRTADGSYGEEHYGLLNAEDAVETANSLANRLNPILQNLSQQSYVNWGTQTTLDDMWSDLDFVQDFLTEENGTISVELEDESSQELPNDLPTDAVEFNGHHYYVYSVDTIQTWDEAKAYCEAQGGYLATITSPEEDKFLYDYLIRSGYESAKFGLTDQNENGAWQWVTGEQSVYSNWHAGEPNHQGGYEHYGMYYRTYRDGSWNDGSDDASVFLCEWGEHNGSIVQLTVTTPQPTDTLDAANTADLTDAGKQTAASDITPPLQREALVAKPPADGRSTLCFNFISRVMELDVGDLRTVLLPEMIDYIIFSSDISIAPQDVADVSFNEDGTVLAWITVDPDITITVHVAGDGIIWLSDGVDMFNGCWELKKIDFGNCVCTTGVVETARMFADCKKLTSLDLSGFDTSSVINMGDMFYGCESLTELNLSGFNTANVNNMAGMFYGCKNITRLDLSGLNTGKVTNMHSMFENCTSLTDVNLSGLDTSNVQFMTSMFRNCSALQTLDLSSFHTGSVSAMDYLFSDCTALRKLNLSSFDMANVKNVKEMFKFCTSLETPELGNCDRLSSEKLMDTYQHRHLTNFDCLADAKTGDFIELNVDPPGWRKLGEDENHYYLLYGDYLPNSYISKWIKAGYIKTDTKYITLVGDYGVYFERATDSDMNAFLLDEGNWVALHDQFLEAFPHHDIRVMGGPTRELFAGKDYMNQQNSLFRPRKAPFDGIIDYLMASEQQRDCEIFNWWGGVSQNVGDGQHALRPVVAVSKQEH